MEQEFTLYYRRFTRGSPAPGFAIHIAREHGVWGGRNFPLYVRVRRGTVLSAHGQCAMPLVDKTLASQRTKGGGDHAAP